MDHRRVNVLQRRKKFIAAKKKSKSDEVELEKACAL